MNVYVLITTPIQTNTYVVQNGGRAFVVDPGDDAERIKAFAAEKGVVIEQILLTHGHFDHIGAVADLQESGAKVFIHKDDVKMTSSFRNLAFAAGKKLKYFTPDVTLNGGEVLNAAGLEVKVMHTSGHTEGGVCYIVENVIFTGDTIFKLDYGRTDLPGGSYKQLKNSVINKLFRVQGEYTVYPGHGPASTLDMEKRFNPILTDDEI